MPEAFLVYLRTLSIHTCDCLDGKPDEGTHYSHYVNGRCPAGASCSIRAENHWIYSTHKWLSTLLPWVYQLLLMYSDQTMFLKCLWRNHFQRQPLWRQESNKVFPIEHVWVIREGGDHVLTGQPGIVPTPFHPLTNALMFLNSTALFEIVLDSFQRNKFVLACWPGKSCDLWDLGA